MKKQEFEICARAIIEYRGKILVCQDKENGYLFFPGGHINFGEDAKKTLLREIKEELSITIKKWVFIGTVENIYDGKDRRHHEINLVFNTKVRKINTQSQEDHIGFLLISKKQFAKEKVLPIALQKAILKWLKDKKMFWASQIHKKSILTNFY